VWSGAAWVSGAMFGTWYWAYLGGKYGGAMFWRAWNGWEGGVLGADGIRSAIPLGEVFGVEFMGGEHSGIALHSIDCIFRIGLASGFLE